MVMRWVDEIDDAAPMPALEPFYVLAALKLGDPDSENWLTRNATDFHALYRQYRRDITECGRVQSSLPLPTESSAVLIQYMVWYDRDSRSLKEGNPR